MMKNVVLYYLRTLLIKIVLQLLSLMNLESVQKQTEMNLLLNKNLRKILED